MGHNQCDEAIKSSAFLGFGHCLVNNKNNRALLTHDTKRCNNLNSKHKLSWQFMQIYCYICLSGFAKNVWQKKFQVHFNSLTPKSNGNFANRETCSFIRLNDAFRETLLKAAEKTLQEPSSVEYARWFQTDIQRQLWEVIKSAFFYGGGGGA